LGAGIQLYGELSGVTSSQPDAVIGGALGYKEVVGVGVETSLTDSAPNVAVEFSLGIPDSGTLPGVGGTLGWQWRGDEEIMVAVPSKISVNYSDKNLLAFKEFFDFVEYGKFRYVRPLPESPIYAPESIMWEMWHQGHNAYTGMKYPFAEWEDGWPSWEQP